MSCYYTYANRALVFAMALTLTVFSSRNIFAQPIATPPLPRPAPAFDPNADLDDSEIEEMDEESPGRPPPPPPPLNSSQAQPIPSPSTPDLRSKGAPTTEAKVKFKIVDDVYFEKGKRRGRSSDNRKSFAKPTTPSPSDF